MKVCFIGLYGVYLLDEDFGFLLFILICVFYNLGVYDFGLVM